MKLFRFKKFGLYRRKRVIMGGQLVNLLGLAFIPCLPWRHRRRPWRGIVRVSIAEPPAQSREQHIASHM